MCKDECYTRRGARCGRVDAGNASTSNGAIHQRTITQSLERDFSSEPCLALHFERPVDALDRLSHRGLGVFRVIREWPYLGADRLLRDIHTRAPLLRSFRQATMARVASSILNALSRS